jgi:hypothetical protein
MMTTKTFLTIHSVIYAFFAAALFFLSSFLWPNYGVQINDQYALFLSQHNSIFLGGIAALGFLFRDAAPGSEVQRKILLGLLVTNLLGVLITLYACLIGVFTGFGWSDPIFFAVLSGLIALQLRNSNQRST